LKRKIKIDTCGKVNYAGCGSIEYAFVAGPESNRKMITPFYSCRDYINDTMIAFYNKGGSHWNDEMLPLDTKHLRMLITIKNKLDDSKKRIARIYTAKRILNMYEEVAGWEGRSIISRVDTDTDKIVHCWQLLGPEQWMHFSCLTSMVTLIFRVVQYHGGFSKLETLKNVEKLFAKIAGVGERYMSDRGYLNNAWPKFQMYMKNYNKLFGQYTPQQLHPASCLGDWHGPGGINSLSQFGTHVEIVDVNVKKTWKAMEGETL